MIMQDAPTCRQCGDMFEPLSLGTTQVYCSRLCRDRASRDRARLSAVRARTRPPKTARPSLRNARGDAERHGDRDIHWSTVGERDGWVCHLCYRPVERVAGVNGRPRGATVDHLIPVSVGGEHVWRNVALAHRSCNSARGVGGVVQLRLVG